MVEKARKAYNRKGDKETIEGILTRIQKFSEDLNLGVTMDIQDSLAKLAQLFKEDTQKLQETLEGMQSEAAQRGDQQETQHGEIRNALEEVKQLIISTGGGSGAGTVDVGASSGGTFSALPSLRASYKFVIKESGADCSSDDDDSASIGEGAFGEVFLMRGNTDNQLYAVKLIKVKKAENNGVNKKQMLQEGSNMQRLTHQNPLIGSSLVLSKRRLSLFNAKL